MSASELYTLKYDISRALSDPEKEQTTTDSDSPTPRVHPLSKTDKARLRQIQKEVTWIGQAFWAYSFADLGYSVSVLLRTYRNNQFQLQKMAQKTTLVCTLRLFVVYEASRYLIAQHMLKNAKPILARKTDNPRRQDLLEKMNQF